MTTTELQPSKLGTKEHWDNVYQEELSNFAELGEEGEIWFGQESLDKMVEWTLEHYPSGAEAPPLNILEVGSGNGTLLFGLAEAGFDPSALYGIDYSAGATALSKEIAKTRGEGADKITFSQCDFLHDLPPHPANGQKDTSVTDGMNAEDNVAVWDLLLDKGTYDAIALGKKDGEGHSPALHYPSRVARLLKLGGRFLITSCNFTESELKSHFETPGTNLKYHSRIQHPVFTFGGKQGSICSSVAFEKV